jgi:hypothetical protein
MTQRQLERELSHATGESVSTIRNLGFQLVEPPDLEPLTVDWDAVQAERMAIFPARECRMRAA